jgi:hypothetical protein
MEDGLNVASKNNQSPFELFAGIPGFKDGWTKFCEATSATSGFFATWSNHLTVDIFHALPSENAHLQR